MASRAPGWSSVEVGKLADLVLWKPAFFGVKVNMVLQERHGRQHSISDMERLDLDATGRCRSAPCGATTAGRCAPQLAFVAGQPGQSGGQRTGAEQSAWRPGARMPWRDQ